MRRSSLSLIFVLAILSAYGCGDGGNGNGNTNPAVDELLDTDVDRYLDAITPSQMTTNGAWDEYSYDPAKQEAICLTGLKYQVNVHRGTVNKTLLYLEGGGACWNEATCYMAPLAKTFSNSALANGAIDLNRVENPFHGWNIVYAPYCDGSVFGGDNTLDYGGKRTYHHGLMNLSAAVSVMREQFPDPEQIVVAGSSAGGYGTYSGYAVTRVAFPESEILVLDDSGPGLQNPGDQATAEARLTNWKFRQFVPESCENCDEQLTYLTEWALDRDPTLRVGYFNYLRDSVLQFFLSLSGVEFEALFREITGDIRSRQEDRFKRFLPAGMTHTILLSNSFYTESVGGITMRDWTANFLTDGPQWQDVSE